MFFLFLIPFKGSLHAHEFEYACYFYQTRSWGLMIMEVEEVASTKRSVFPWWLMKLLWPGLQKTYLLTSTSEVDALDEVACEGGSSLEECVHLPTSLRNPLWPRKFSGCGVGLVKSTTRFCLPRILASQGNLKLCPKSTLFTWHGTGSPYHVSSLGTVDQAGVASALSMKSQFYPNFCPHFLEHFLLIEKNFRGRW